MTDISGLREQIIGKERPSGPVQNKASTKSVIANASIHYRFASASLEVIVLHWNDENIDRSFQAKLVNTTTKTLLLETEDGFGSILPALFALLAIVTNKMTGEDSGYDAYENSDNEVEG